MLTTLVLFIYQNIVGRELTEKEANIFAGVFFFEFVEEATIGFYYVLR